jgi:class 3 adenylate cyclase
MAIARRPRPISHTGEPVRLSADAPRFVGRRADLAALQAMVTRASRGEPSAAILVGDPGVGKSRLARETELYAESMGVQVCHGRFVEGGPVPYLPWSSALLPRLERAGLLRDSELGGHAEVLLQILEPRGGAPVLSGGRDHEARVLVALTAGVAALARLRPLLFVLDDLHWADPGGLEAFNHLVLTLSDTSSELRLPVCAIATSRVPEPGSTLERALGRLARDPKVRVADIRPLSELEMNELLRDALGAPCAASLLHHLARATGGNPLLLQETLRHLAESGKLIHGPDGVTVAGDAGDTPLPAGIAEAIEARMETLSAECSRLLSLAAMIGDEFSLQLLERVAERDADHVMALLDEAFEARFVVDDRDGFRFAHPMMRKVFEQRGSAARRRRTHLWIAERLANAPGEETASPLEIATHWLAAGDIAPETVRGEWATRAGDQTIGLYAWAEAANYYDAALALDGYTGTLDARELGRIAFGAGLGYQRAMEPEAARARLDQAIELFRDAGDLEGWGRALSQWIRVVNGHGSVALGRPADASRFEAFMEAVGDSTPESLGWVFENWAESLYIAGDPGAAVFARRALEMGKAAEDMELCALAANALGLWAQQQLACHEALMYFDEAEAYGKHAHDPWYQSWTRQGSPRLLAALGRIEEAEGVTAEVTRAAARSANWATHAALSASSAHVAAIHGDFLRSDEAAADAQMYLNRSAHSITPILLYYTVAATRVARGDWEGAFDAVEMVQASGGSRSSWLLQQLVSAAAGNREGAEAEIGAHPGWAYWQSRADMFSMPLLCQRMELAAELGSADLAGITVEPLEAAVRAGLAFCTGMPYSLRRELGVGYRLLGRLDEAEYVLERAIEETGAATARPELARAQFELGRVLLARAEGPDADRGVAAVNAALALAEELGMRPLRDRARSLLGGSGAQPVAVPASSLSETDTDVLIAMARGDTTQAIADRLLLGTRTVERAKRRLASDLGVRGRAAAAAYAEAHGLSFDLAAGGPTLLEEPPAPAPGRLRVMMFEDIVESTPLNEALGDQQYFELLTRHDRLVHGTIRRHGGAVVKHTGDGVFASFDSALQALEACRQIAAAFPIALQDWPGRPLAIRVGLHAGEPVATDSDLFGLAVTLTRRICDRARDGHVLVSESVRALADGTEYRFRAAGRYSLKGLNQRHQLYELAGEASSE